MKKNKHAKRSSAAIVTLSLLVVIAVLVVAAGVWWSQYRIYRVADAPMPVAGQPVAHVPTPETTQPVALGEEFFQALADPALGEISVSITDVLQGQQLFQQQADTPLVPASSTKVLTAAAALLVLDPASQVQTRVYEAAPGELVIVGGGDVTLEATPGSGFFTAPANVQDLASQTFAALGERVGEVHSIRVDNSVRAGSTFGDSWDRRDIEGGNIADLDAVMLNAGRIVPKDSYSPRSDTPAEDVAQVFAAQLGRPDVAITVTDEPINPQATVLAEVHSAPLIERLRDMMLHSDNLLAEAIAREVAVAVGQPATFAGAVEATQQVLRNQGIDLSAVQLYDNSGMSTNNRLTANVLDKVLGLSETGEIFDTLPAAGVEGTLSDRYDAASGAQSAAGWVRAKTGTLDGVSALVGVVATVEGRPLTFAFLSNGTSPDVARPALDRLANALRNS